jgi:hypothetical protein
MRLSSPSLVLLMLLAAAPAAAAPPVQPVPQSPAPPAGTPAPARDDDSGRQKSSAPARTFTPSEKIKADSAVAFPVDI